MSVDLESIIKENGLRSVAPGLKLRHRENGKMVEIGEAVAWGEYTGYLTKDLLLALSKEPVVFESVDGREKALEKLKDQMGKAADKYGKKAGIEMKLVEEAWDGREI